jgi:hypothetical protein
MVRAAGFKSGANKEKSGESEGDAQNIVVLGHDLSRIVTAWPKISPQFKTAILAIVASVQWFDLMMWIHSNCPQLETTEEVSSRGAEKCAKRHK